MLLFILNFCLLNFLGLEGFLFCLNIIHGVKKLTCNLILDKGEI